MFSHDYYKEIGLQSPEKRVSKLTAALIFAVFGAAAYYGYRHYAPRLQDFLANRPPEIVVVSAHEASRTPAPTPANAAKGK